MNYSKTLFSSQFKPIEFIKPAAEEAATRPIGPANDDAKEVQKFYDQLMTRPSPARALEAASPAKTTKSTKTAQPAAAKATPLDSKQFLAAAQNGDLKLLTGFFAQASLSQAVQLLGAVDQYQWNCLMISAASSTNDVLAFLFGHLVDRMTRTADRPDDASTLMNLFHKLTDMKDGSGSNLEKIARQVKNKKAIDLLNSTRQELDALFLASQVKREAHDAGQEPAAETKESFQCPTCGKSFDESEAQHLTSIVHLLNDDKTTSQGNRANYHLRSSNIGYQLLCKQGWNEQRGLGANEQGKIYPVKATVKHDRLGIGLAAPTKPAAQEPVSLAKRPVRLRKAVCQRGDALLMRTIKAEAQRPKRIEKEKAFAKSFRLYYNQD